MIEMSSQIERMQEIEMCGGSPANVETCASSNQSIDPSISTSFIYMIEGSLMINSSCSQQLSISRHRSIYPSRDRALAWAGATDDEGYMHVVDPSGPASRRH
jgi:hypothetical protein